MFTKRVEVSRPNAGLPKHAGLGKLLLKVLHRAFRGGGSLLLGSLNLPGFLLLGLLLRRFVVFLVLGFGMVRGHGWYSF